MNKEWNYGTDDVTCWTDGDAPGGRPSSTVDPQEELTEEDNREHLTIFNSNRYLDKFLFYYSSRL